MDLIFNIRTLTLLKIRYCAYVLINDVKIIVSVLLPIVSFFFHDTRTPIEIQIGINEAGITGSWIDLLTFRYVDSSNMAGVTMSNVDYKNIVYKL